VRRRTAAAVFAGLMPMAASAPGAPAPSIDTSTTLEFSTTHEANTPMHRYASQYLARLCTENGLRCHLANLPARRSEAQLSTGTLDGELGRVRAFAHKHPEFVLVDPAFVTLHTYVFTPAGKPEIGSWAELGKLAGSVAYKRGVFIYQQRLEAMRPSVQAHDVQDVAACLQMVLTGRDLACVIDDGNMGDSLRPLLAQGHLSQPLEELELHIVMHRSRAALAAVLSASASRWHAHGIDRQLRRDYFEAHWALAQH
jgi:ABC-type amino acid transport substrate-binding protein